MQDYVSSHRFRSRKQLAEEKKSNYDKRIICRLCVENDAYRYGNIVQVKYISVTGKYRNRAFFSEKIKLTEKTNEYIIDILLNADICA